MVSHGHSLINSLTDEPPLLTLGHYQLVSEWNPLVLALGIRNPKDGEGWGRFRKVALKVSQINEGRTIQAPLFNPIESGPKVRSAAAHNPDFQGHIFGLELLYFLDSIIGVNQRNRGLAILNDNGDFLGELLYQGGFAPSRAACVHDDDKGPHFFRDAGRKVEALTDKAAVGPHPIVIVAGGQFDEPPQDFPPGQGRVDNVFHHAGQTAREFSRPLGRIGRLGGGNLPVLCLPIEFALSRGGSIGVGVIPDLSDVPGIGGLALAVLDLGLGLGKSGISVFRG